MRNFMTICLVGAELCHADGRQTACPNTVVYLTTLVATAFRPAVTWKARERKGS